MFTLESVVGQVIDPTTLPLEEVWPRGFLPATMLPLAGGGKIRLPIDPRGLRLGEIDEGTTALFGQHALAARAIVLTRGTFATPLLLGQASGQASLPGRGRVRHVLNAARILGADGRSVYGVGTFVHNDAALRPGSSTLDYVSHEWHADADDFAVSLSSRLMQAAGGVEPRHERNAYPWKKATLLLSGAEPKDSERLVRRLRFAAGLFEVTLQVEFNADSRFQDLTRTIKARPPNQLLVREQVASGAKYMDTFARANPNGYSDWLQQPLDSGVDGLARELVCHLALLKETAERVLPPMEWTEAEAEIRALVKDADGVIILTDRAWRTLPNNPYPDPRRMLDHFRLLVDLAHKYSDGTLGGRLVEAGAETGLTIALFDGALRPANLVLDGAVTSLRAEPHVKVDDYVSPDRCGRIYFALDGGQRLVVDHIGLHDYT